MVPAATTASSDHRHLGDRVKVPPLVEDEIDMGERFETSAEPALCLANPFGDGPDLPVVGTEQHHNPVGLPERVGAQDDALVVTNAHDAPA
jgi:hypothetical protein